MANWVAWWYRASTDGDPGNLAETLVDLVMTGVRRDDDRQVQPGPWAALTLLKEDISHLETALSAVQPPEPASILSTDRDGETENPRLRDE